MSAVLQTNKATPDSSQMAAAGLRAFARIADDFADEGERSNDARLALLDDWDRRLADASAGGEEVVPGICHGRGPSTHVGAADGPTTVVLPAFGTTGLDLDPPSGRRRGAEVRLGTAFLG